MQTFCVDTGWKRRAFALAIVVGGAALLPWHLRAQIPADKKPQAPVQSGEPEQKIGFYRSVKVGDYTLKIADADSIWASEAPPEAKERVRKERLRAAADAGNPGKPVSPSRIDPERPFYPNLTLRLAIEGRNPEDAMLVQGLSRIRAHDDQGRALLTPDMAQPADRTLPRKENANQKQQALLFLKEADAKSVPTLEGFLVVLNGLVRTLTFDGDEMRSGISKSSGQVSATLESIHSLMGRCEVTVRCLSTQYDSHDGSTVEAIEHSMWGRRTPRAALVGSDGVIYWNNGLSLSSGPDSSYPQAGFSRPAGLTHYIAHMTFHFAPIPEGITSQKLRVYMVEQQGANFQVPVKFTDIPLADPE